MKKLLHFLGKHWLPIVIIVVLGVYFFNGVPGLSRNSFGPEGYYQDEALSSYSVKSSRGMTAQFAMDGDFAEMEEARVAPSSSFYPGEDSAGGPADVEAKIIKSGSLDLHVNDVRQSVGEVKEYVSSIGGSVLNSNVNRGEEAYYAWLNVRVPADQFDTAVEALSDLAIYVNSENVNAQDVTDSYIDVETRLQTLRAQETQYLNILNDAETVEEVLRVTDSLNNVRYQIESQENRLEYYDTRIDYSTISINLSEDTVVSTATGKWRPIASIKESFKDWVIFLQGLADRLIDLVIFGWPVLVIYIVWRIAKRRK